MEALYFQAIFEKFGSAHISDVVFFVTVSRPAILPGDTVLV